MKYLQQIKIFLRYVWRDFTPEGKEKQRLSISDAWEVAKGLNGMDCAEYEGEVE